MAVNNFLIFLSVLLVFSAVSCLFLHYIIKPENTLLPPERLIQFDSAGRLCHVSESDIRWYLGSEDTATLVAALKDRSQRIDSLEDKVVRQSLMEFQVRFSSAGELEGDAANQVREFAAMARSGEFSNTAVLFSEIVGGWSDDTRKFVGENSIFDLNYGLKELARLKQHQLDARSQSLQPPLTHQIFWMSPQWVLVEVVYWSLFGTLVNLLVNISQARAHGRFTRDEFWISFSKIIYGPILSFVLILAIYFGLINPGTEVRFWFLPLAGFLFGYNTRKTAVLIDQLSAKLFGTTSKSVQQIGKIKAQAADQAADAIRARARPASFSELKQQAVIVADTAITAAVLKQQSQR